MQQSRVEISPLLFATFPLDDRHRYAGSARSFERVRAAVVNDQSHNLDRQPSAALRIQDRLKVAAVTRRQNERSRRGREQRIASNVSAMRAPTASAYHRTSASSLTAAISAR